MEVSITGICRESDFSLEKGEGCNYCIEKKEGYISGKGWLVIPWIRGRDIKMKKKEGYICTSRKEGGMYLWRRERDICIFEKRKVSKYL